MTGYTLSQVKEILVTGFDRLNMRADRTIRRFEEEHRFVGLHSQRHQAAIVLELGQAIWVIRNRWHLTGLSIQHSLPVNKGDAVHPSHVGLYGTTVPYAVLHHYVTRRHHLA